MQSTNWSILNSCQNKKPILNDILYFAILKSRYSHYFEEGLKSLNFTRWNNFCNSVQVLVSKEAFCITLNITIASAVHSRSSDGYVPLCFHCFENLTVPRAIERYRYRYRKKLLNSRNHYGRRVKILKKVWKFKRNSNANTNILFTVWDEIYSTWPLWQLLLCYYVNYWGLQSPWGPRLLWLCRVTYCFDIYAKVISFYYVKNM